MQPSEFDPTRVPPEQSNEQPATEAPTNDNAGDAPTARRVNADDFSSTPNVGGNDYAAAPIMNNYGAGPNADANGYAAPTPAYDGFQTPFEPVPTYTYPPTAAAATTAQPPRWRQMLIPIMLLIVLAVGVGIGLIFANNHASSASKINTATPLSSSNTSVSLPSTVQDLQQTVISVVHTVDPSVVEVKSSGSSGSAIGTGEFLTKDGYIVTNAHVVAGSSTFSVTLSTGATQSAQLVGADTQDDLAVLKTNITNATPIVFTDSSKAQIGQFVIAIGSPLGLDQSATFGIVSATNRTEQEDSSNANSFSNSAGPVLTGLIQTSAAINPGNSGGALVDLNGRLLGITTLGASGTSQGETISGIGFAIPSNRVQTITTQLMQGGQVTSSGQGFLGIQGQDVTSQSGLSVQQGVLVAGFANDAAGASPAQAAGLQVNDVIISANGQSIASSTDLANAILTHAPGSKISVTVVRGSSQKTVNVTLGERPTQG